MSLVLTYDELVALTHYRRPAEQIAALNSMNIGYMVRPDGTPAVLRSTLEGRDNPEKQPKVRSA